MTITAALWAAVFLFVALTLPPATRGAADFHHPPVRRGAFHVHTTASDGGGTREDVARAAAAAGLDFVILTDHGDGTRPPAPPEYLHGVLVIDGVEVTTSGGHYAAFGLAQAPYPLGGPAYAVIEDVARLGGMGVAAHPDSPKAGLRWRDWNARIDGFEWINGDSAWRDEGLMTMARGLVDYLVRPAPVLASMVEQPGRLLRRLDDMTRARRVVAIAGADAHARLPLTSDDEPYGAAWTLPAPSYTHSFRAFANLVEEDGASRSGDAARDADVLMRAIRDGRVSFAMTALAVPAHLHFQAVQADDPSVVYRTGARVEASAPLTFSVRVSDVGAPGASDVRLALVRNGEIAAQADGPSLSHRADDARGVWRVEATLAGRPGIPWMLSNPIAVGMGEPSQPAIPAGPGPAAAAPVPVEAALDLSGGTWSIEKHAASSGRVEAWDGQRVSYQLAGGMPAGQFVAAVRATDNAEAWDTVVMTARAPVPTRAWVQLRLSDSGTGQRWGRSVYLDSTARTYRLSLRDFAPLESRPTASRPNIAQVRAVLLVIDTVNSQPGRSGQFHIHSLALERRAQQ